MKKVMWILTLLSFVLDAAALQFLPDTVPMHFNLAGDIDRWGSKYETLVFPVIILAFSLFWHLFISSFEKKAKTAADEKAIAEARSNAKVMTIAGAAVAAMLTALEVFSLYQAYQGGAAGAGDFKIEPGKVSCFLGGVVFLVLGNFMPKSKMNRLVGVRVKWSMYNDVTWMKSNRFGGAALVAAGVASILTAVFAKANLALILMLIYLLIAVTGTIVYARKVYQQEVSAAER